MHIKSVMPLQEEVLPKPTAAHLNRDKIESKLSVPVIQGHQEYALIKSCEMSPHLICL